MPMSLQANVRSRATDAWLAVLVVAAVALLHVAYVRAAVIDLAEDEAYYWDWSRHLDYSYYSKGPGTAWLIRASCTLFGDTPLGVRFPAIMARAGVGLCTFWLTRKLFGSSRLALGATLLGYAVPMFLAAGLIMTTDPMYLLCWGLATCFAAKAIWDDKPWALVAAGAVVGVGLLGKFSMPLWFVGLFAYLIIDARGRKYLGTRWLWLAIAVAALFALPVLVWIHRHDYVTFLHVGEDIGVMDGDLHWKNFRDFWLGQLGVAGPVAFVIAPAMIWAVRRGGDGRRERAGANPLLFLLMFSLPVLVAVMLSSLRKHASANWCTAAYFGLVILAAAWLGQARGRGVKVMAAVCIVLGFILVEVAHWTEGLYPVVGWLQGKYPRAAITVKRVDPTYRVHGWSEAGSVISDHRDALGKDALVLAHDYQTTAALAFYVRGQPAARTVGAYLRPPYREPFSQYDLWPHRKLDDPSLVGRDAVYVGRMTDDLRAAFNQVQRVEDVVIVRRGVEVRRFEVHACRGFRGLTWQGWAGKYNK